MSEGEQNVGVRVALLLTQKTKLFLMLGNEISPLFLGSFDAFVDRVEDSIEYSRLLAIVLATLAVPMVQVMIFDGQIHAERSEHFAEQRMRPEHARTTVAHAFDVHENALSDPEFVRRKRHHQRRTQRNENDFDQLLHVTGENTLQWRGMLRRVVLAVVFPEKGNGVNRTMIRPEDEVQANQPEANLDRK